jgi:integrase
MAYVVKFPARVRYEVREKVKKPDGGWSAVTIKVFHTLAEADMFVANDKLKNSVGRKVSLAAGKVRFADALKEYKTDVLEAPIPLSGGGKWKGKGWTRSHQSMYVVRKLIDSAELTWLAKKELGEMTYEDIDQYIEQRESDDVSGSTINRELNVISPFLNWAKYTYKMRHWDNPVEDCDRPQSSDSRDRILTADERLEIERACEKSGSPTLRYAFVFALETAIRRGELCKLKWSDVHIDGPDAPHLNLRKETTKTKKARAIPVSPLALKAFQDLRQWRAERMAREDDLRSRRQSVDVYDFDFVLLGTTATAIGQAFRRVMANTNVENFRWHDCRHCATTHLAELYQALELSQITGHSDMRMLQRYYNPHGAKLAERMYAKVAPNHSTTSHPIC